MWKSDEGKFKEWRPVVKAKTPERVLLDVLADRVSFAGAVESCKWTFASADFHGPNYKAIRTDGSVVGIWLFAPTWVVVTKSGEKTLRIQKKFMLSANEMTAETSVDCWFVWPTDEGMFCANFHDVMEIQRRLKCELEAIPVDVDACLLVDQVDWNKARART